MIHSGLSVVLLRSWYRPWPKKPGTAGSRRKGTSESWVYIGGPVVCAMFASRQHGANRSLQMENYLAGPPPLAGSYVHWWEGNFGFVLILNGTLF